MDKLAYQYHFRLTEGENQRLEALMQRGGADRSTILRLALKRLFRKPPTRRFRHRPKRGAKL